MNENYENENNCNCEDCQHEEEFTAWQLMEPIVINTNVLEDITIDANEFQDGVTNMSYVAGQFSALINVGVDRESAIAFLMNLENAKHNQIMAEIEKEKAVEMARISEIKEERNNL